MILLLHRILHYCSFQLHYIRSNYLTTFFQLYLFTCSYEVGFPHGIRTLRSVRRKKKRKKYFRAFSNFSTYLIVFWSVKPALRACSGYQRVERTRVWSSPSRSTPSRTATLRTGRTTWRTRVPRKPVGVTWRTRVPRTPVGGRAPPIPATHAKKSTYDFHRKIMKNL